MQHLQCLGANITTATVKEEQVAHARLPGERNIGSGTLGGKVMGNEQRKKYCQMNDGTWTNCLFPVVRATDPIAGL